MHTEMKRPMLFIAAFSAASALLSAAGLGKWLIAAAAVLMAVICGFIFRRGILPLIIAVAFASAIAFGFSAMETKAERLAEEYHGKEITLEGEVYSPPMIYDGREVYVLKTELGLVELTRYGNRAESAEIGDNVRLDVKLSAPSLPDNDYAFNSKRYQYSRRIYLTATDTGEMEIKKCDKINPRIIAGRIQNAAVQTGESYMYGDALGLYGAIAFGDKRYMSSSLKRTLTAAGLSHIAAVSGMHLSIVAVIIMFLIFKLIGRGRIGYSAAIMAVLAFTLLTGAGNSVVRACIMSIIYLAAQMIYRDADPLSSLSAAVAAMLLFNPMVIYSAGFQLSVLSTLGILLFMPVWEERLPSLPRPLKAVVEIVLVSTAAQLGVFPVLIWQFNSFPTYFILSNLAVVPVLTIAMPLGLLMPLADKLPYLNRLWGAFCSAVFKYIAVAAGKVSCLPKATTAVGSPDAALVAAYVFVAAALLLAFKRYKKTAVIMTAAAMVFIGIGSARIYAADKRAALSFLNVGRGDCAVFCLPKGRTVMIDSGSDGQTAIEFLEGRGRSRVDAAVLTCDKREHIGGMTDMVESGLIARLLIPEELMNSEECRYLCFAAEDNGIPVEYYGEGSEFYIAGLKISRFAYNGGASLIANYGETKVFFCSDGYTPWEADCGIVKTPNHGSGKYNYLNEFNKAKPEYAVVSGRSASIDKSGYLDTMTDMGIPFYVTGERGTVTFDLSGEEITVRTTK